MTWSRGAYLKERNGKHLNIRQRRLLVITCPEDKDQKNCSNTFNEALMKFDQIPGSANVHARRQGWGRETDERGVAQCPQLKRGAHNKVGKSKRVKV